MNKTENIKREKVTLLPSEFYMENGFKVMKEEYHIKRGYCCCSGCRHCTYTPKSIKGNTTLIEK